MKIAFTCQHKYFGGLANNGGSRTILLSAKTLRDMGHKVHVVTHTDRHSWIKHPKPKRLIPEDVDVCIAVSVSDIIPMLRTAPKHAKKAFWMRGYEKWQMLSKQIIDTLRKFYMDGHIIMVNSGWLQKKLAHYTIGSNLVWAGLDFHEWKDRKMRMPGKTVGALYSSRPSKGWKYVEKLAYSRGGENIRFVSFGSEKREGFGTHYANPSHDRLVNIYSSCQIWFSTSTLEGFHNPPSEAALCGCLPVVPADPRGGCADYCTPETAMVYGSFDEAVRMIKAPDYSKVPKLQKYLREKIGDREKNMKRLVEVFK